jgi:hypothetical protein
MFTLIDQHGKPALKRDGTPFEYTSRELARTAARVLGAGKDEESKRFFKVVSA